MEPTRIHFNDLANQVADKVNAMLAYWDADLVCRFANAAYLDWFGRTKEEMVDKMRISELLGQSIFDRNLPFILGALGGKIQTFEREIVSPEGSVRYALANYFPHSVEGKVVGFFVHVADVTPVKLLEKSLEKSNQVIAEQNLNLIKDNQIITMRTEELKSAFDDISTINEELRASNEELSSVNDQLLLAYRTIESQAHELRESVKRLKEITEIKDRFVSTVSHEFRTPLSVILLCTEFIRRYRDKATEQQIDTKIDAVKRHINFMTTLLNDILEIRKFEESKIEVRKKEVNLSLFKELTEEVFQAAGTKNELNFSLNRSDVSIITDERLLHNIVVNLVSNAVKYSPDSTPVEVRIDGDASQLVIVVKDFGLGIPGEDIENLFVSFHRGKNVGEIQGTGLGLTIVKQAVELLGGEIEVKSQLRMGTTFTVTIPLNNS